LPILSQVIQGTGLWFGWLWDYVGTPAFAVTYNEDQAGGVDGYSQSSQNGVITSVFQLSGKPRGRYATWLEIDSPVPLPTPDAPTVVNLTPTRREVLDFGVYIPAVFAVASVNETALSVTFAFSDALDFSSIIATNHVDVDVANLSADYGWAGSAFVDPGITYYVRATPYSGVLSAGVPTGTAGQPVIATTATTPAPTDTATLEWDTSDPAELKANVVGATPAGAAGGALGGTYPDPTLASEVGFSVEFGGEVIEAGDSDYVRIPADSTITAGELVADVSGSVTVEVWRATYSAFPTFTKISASAPLTLSSAQKSQPTLTSWTTSLAVGDYLKFVITGTPATITRLTGTLALTRT